MTSGEDWQNGVKEEGDNESMLVDVESHEDLPNMKRESEDSLNDQSASHTTIKHKTPPDLLGWLKHFRAQVLAPLLRNVKSNPFRNPVDAIALGIYPIYFEVVKTPMDLGTIRQKIEDGVYVKKEEVTTDLMLVWDNAMTFNSAEHLIHKTAAELKAQSLSRLEKLERDGIPPPNTPKPPVPVVQLKRDNLVRRDARKKSFDLPGEISTPQHLEQKYVSKLSSSLKACDLILKNLMSLKLHRDSVEPFIHVERKTESDAYQPMSLTKIQQRMRMLQYSHPMEFADDMRRIVTETYRYCHPDDPIVSAAAKLQQEFEMQFARINFQENELVPEILSASAGEDDDEYISKLLSTQNFMVQIQTDLTELIRDYMRMKSRKKKQNLVTPTTSSALLPVSRQSSVAKPSAAAARQTPATPVSRPVMQGQLVQRPSNTGKEFMHRPSTSGKQFLQRPTEESSSAPPPKKKARTESTSSATPKPVLTLPEANALKDEISMLDPTHQFKVLEILQANGEKMMPDENGEVEIEIFRCSAKSVADVKAFLNFVKNQQKMKNSGGQHSKSGKVMTKPSKNEAEKVSTLSDSSSSESSSDSSSDSSDSSDSEDDN